MTAQAQRYGTSGDLGEASRDNDVRRADGSRNPCRQRERHGQAVRQADHAVFNRVAASKVFFPVI